MKLAYVVAFTALFLNTAGEDQQPAPENPPAQAPVAATQPEVVPLGPVTELPVEEKQPVFVVPELPADMKVIVNGKAGVKRLTLVHQGHLVTLRSGDTVVLGDNSVSLPLKDATSITWESSERKTFATLRGVVEWEVSSNSRETPKLRATESVSPEREISAARHECKAFPARDEVVTVMCRVDSLAVGAARPFATKAQDGIVMVESGERRYYRMDLDPNKNEFDAVVIGYSDGARGHVIRAETSKLPGEKKASFTLLAAQRAQPIPIRRFFSHHDPPHPLDFFL